MVRKFGGDIQHYLRTHSRRGTWRNSPIFLDAKQKTHLYSASFIHLCFMSVTMMHKNADFTIYYISQYHNVARNLDNADTVYGSGGLMVNGDVLAGDFNITVEKKVEFLDDVSQEEQAEILGKEFKFELLITDSSGEIINSAMPSLSRKSPLRTVKVTGNSSLTGSREIETQLRFLSKGIVLACDFILKANERMTFSFSWDDNSSFAHRELTFQLFETDTGGALRTEIKQDVIRGDEEYEDEKKIETIAFVCMNTFGEPDTGELDISKTVEGTGQDRFWSFDVTVGNPIAEGVLSPGNNTVTFVNENQSASAALVSPMALDASENLSSHVLQVRYGGSSYPSGFFEPDFKYIVRVTADEPLNDTYTLERHLATGRPVSTTFVNGVWEYETEPVLNPNSAARDIYLVLPEYIGFTVTFSTNYPDMYELSGTLSYRIDGGPAPTRDPYAKSFSFPHTERIYPGAPETDGFLTVTNTVIGDADGQTFRYTVKFFDDNDYEESGPFTLGPGESHTLSPYSAGLHYKVTQEPVEGFDTRVSVDGTYSVELWEGGASSHLTGNNGGIEFADGVGTVTFVNGKASVQLKHGQMLKIKGLESNLDYNVTEREANSGGYTTEATGTTGKIPVDSAAVAAFTNVFLAVTLPQTGGPGREFLTQISLLSCAIGISLILIAKRKSLIFCK